MIKRSEGRNAQQIRQRNKTLILNEEQFLSELYSKFIIYAISKYEFKILNQKRIPLKDIYQTLGCLFSLRRRQARLFLRCLVEELPFIKRHNHGLKLEIELWQ